MNYKQLQKFIALSFTIVLLSIKLDAQTELRYYLPENTVFNPEIPTPQETTGYSVGDWHFSHDQILQYAKKIAEVSERAIMKEYARSWENRPLVYLIFTDPDNHSKLEEIRLSHIETAKYGGQRNSEEKEPLVIHLGYGVHGNESSASNSSLLTLYYLAASEDEWVTELLKSSIIIVDPCLNPDGFTRHSSWINMNRSQTLVSDPAARGFNETWPGARTNHYWFDLNRDYIPLTHPESKGRINLFHSWLPHILTDHHEMGANSTFFFQPGVETRNNPIVPEKNYVLTKEIAGFHSRALDKFGITYFTEERFDDYYFGKGSSYPDANGGIGILFEQAGFRGHLRETDHGLKTFSYAVRNQFNVTLSTLRAGMDLKEDLINYQREFFSGGLQKADSCPVKAYIFGEEFDHTRLQNFIELLLNHKIEVHRIEKDLQVENKFYSKENSYLVLTAQEQFHLIRSLFDPVNEFRDSTFYDVSTWTLPFAFNLDYSEINSIKVTNDVIGELVEEKPSYNSKIYGRGDYALLMQWDEYNAPAALYQLQDAGLKTYVSMDKFGLEDKDYDYGTIFIPLQDQNLKAEKIFDLVEKISSKYNVDFTRVSTGQTLYGINMGSERMERIHKPEVALLTGEDAHSNTTGEIWHHLDINYNMPVSLVDGERISRSDLSRYSVICLAGWNFSSMGNTGKEKLEKWIEEGGTLISVVYPLSWLNSNELLEVNFIDEAQIDPEAFIYADRYKMNDTHRIAGSIFQIKADLSHPLFYGYNNPLIPVFKNRSTVIENSGRAFAHPAKYTESPLLSGYSSEENIERIKGSPSIFIWKKGGGRIIHFMDNPNFRGKWYGTSKMFANAVFFGGIL